MLFMEWRRQLDFIGMWNWGWGGGRAARFLFNHPTILALTFSESLLTVVHAEGTDANCFGVSA